MSNDSKNLSFKTRLARWMRVTCKDTSPLISELMDHDLPWGKKLRLRIHLAMCGVCEIYKSQLEVIQALARKLGREEIPGDLNSGLSDTAKIKIKNALKQSN